MSLGQDSLRILGVMTGTSCDGLDAACIRVDDSGWEPLWAESLPYPKKLRSKVHGIQKPGTKLTLLEQLELTRDLGRWYGESVAKLLAGRSASERPDVVANHGQTVAHHPGKSVTLQLGEPVWIARATNLTVVSRFREGDIAAHGQGAPLVPLFHRMIAGRVAKGRAGIAIHNIGGISNFTYVAPDGSLLAFDSGPGNLWIDGATAHATRGKQTYDRGGALAAKGDADARAVAKLMTLPYFKAKPPKSTGRDDFRVEQVLKATRVRGADLVATATEATAVSIADAYRRFVIDTGKPLAAVYVCGGGAKNPSLLSRIEALLAGVRVESLEQAGIDPTWIEAQAFAYFGYHSLRGRPIGGPWTGAEGFGPPGQITPGENWDQVLDKLTQSPSKPMPRPSVSAVASP